MAAALAPVTSLRLSPYSAKRFLSFYPKTLLKPQALPPLLRRRPFQFYGIVPATTRRRCFCSIISGAPQSGKSSTMELVEKASKVGEFRRKLKIADIKVGPDEGLDRVGQKLVVLGWVRTLRVQSSVTFLEVSVYFFGFFHQLCFPRLVST